MLRGRQKTGRCQQVAKEEAAGVQQRSIHVAGSENKLPFSRKIGENGRHGPCTPRGSPCHAGKGSPLEEVVKKYAASCAGPGFAYQVKMGKELAKSCTSLRVLAITFASPMLFKTVTMKFPTVFMCSSFMPLVVRAAVPMLAPTIIQT